MAPPRTWYTPRYSLVRSSALTSLASSTTHINARSRLGDRHIAQGSWSVTLKQTLQNLTRSLTATSASAICTTSSRDIFRMYAASRWAVLRPMVGSLLSCSTRASTDSEVNVIGVKSAL